MPSSQIAELPAKVGTGWRRLVFAGVAVLVLYLPIVPRMVAEWAEFPNLSHGFAIPVIAGYLVWRRRSQIAETPMAWSWAGVLLLGLGLTAYAIGTMAADPFLARVSFPLSLFGGVLSVGGGRVARQLLAPLLYLVFMIPPPPVTLQSVTDWMRLFDAATVASALPWLGVPVLQEGYLLHLPTITLEVADVCSSVPAVVALVATGAAYGLLIGRPPRLVVILLLAAVPLAILSNLVRIALTAVGAHFVGPVVLHDVVHTGGGMWVFVMTLGALMLLDTVIRRWA